MPSRGNELAVFAVGSTTASAEMLSGRVRDIVALKKGPLVPQIGRFSKPPRVEDLKTLTLDDVDFRAIERCRPRDCALKLSSEEIERLHRAGSGYPQGRTSRVEAEFRQVILDRIGRYLSSGLDGIPPYDSGDAVNLRSAFSTLLEHSPYVRSIAPEVASYFERFPNTGLPDSECFLYWSKETAAPKPIISVTHVAVVKGGSEPASPDVVVVSKEVFATRYTSGALVLTLLLPSQTSSSTRYLVYINRTWVDGIRSFWRPFVEWRIKGQAAKVFADARERIEGKSNP